MYYNNGFELIIEVVLSMIHFHLGEGEPLPDFYLKSLAIRREIVLMRYQRVQIKNRTRKYVMELSELKISNATGLPLS